MITQVIAEIKSLIVSDISLNLLDEELLKKLEQYFIDNHYGDYKTSLVAIGLLSLYLNHHKKINKNLAHSEISKLILIGDYFYGLYYEYCAIHAFHLIKYNFAKRIKEFELLTIRDCDCDVFPEIVEFFDEEVPHYELAI